MASIVIGVVIVSVGVVFITRVGLKNVVVIDVVIVAVGVAFAARVVLESFVVIGVPTYKGL